MSHRSPLIVAGDDAIVVVMANEEHEREARIERLKAQAAAAADGRMVVDGTENLTPAMQEEFWREVVAFEPAGTTNLVKELTAIGVPLPEPDGLDDVALYAALWCVIDGLARLNVFLHHTDHLGDRELYTHLLRVILPEEMDAIDGGENSAWHVDVLGYDQPELFLRYYADERTRDAFRPDFPGGLPDHEDRPYDRDSRLPEPSWMARDDE
jgi:hypothetical protein